LRLEGAPPARFHNGGNPAGSLHAHKRKLAPHQLGFEKLRRQTSSAPPSLLLDPPHLLELYCQTSRLRRWPSHLRRCTRSCWSAIPCCSSLCRWMRSHCSAIPAAPPSSIPNTFFCFGCLHVLRAWGIFCFPECAVLCLHMLQKFS
jgi:hypothetical protein